MALTYSDWTKRISKRSDISGMVTHLTKPKRNNLSNLDEWEINQLAIDNLISILKEQKIKGSVTSNGFIIGDKPAVCLQDAPLYGIIQNVEYEKQFRKEKGFSKLRYCGIGLTFGKPYIYTKGGRPVIYDESHIAKRYLPKDEHGRIVRYNINFMDESQTHVDWTHEREWRVPNLIDFELNLCHVVLYDSIVGTILMMYVHKISKTQYMG